MERPLPSDGLIDRLAYWWRKRRGFYNWPETEAKVISSKLLRGPFGGRLLEIRYQYHVGGAVLTGKLTTSEAFQKNFIMHDDTFLIRYNPLKPRKTYSESGSLLELNVIFMTVFALVLLFVILSLATDHRPLFR